MLEFQMACVKTDFFANNRCLFAFQFLPSSFVVLLYFVLLIVLLSSLSVSNVCLYTDVIVIINKMTPK